MTRLLGVLLLGLLTLSSARVISESVFMDMCEAHGRAAGRVAAASSCNTLKAVCLPSETSGRAVFYEDPYFDSVIIDVLRESCELLYKSVCRQTAYQTARRQPACSKILLGSHFATAFCPDVETAVDIFSEGLAECDEIPNMLFEVAGMKKGSSSGKVNSKKKKKNRNKKKSSDEEFPFSTAFLRSTLGRTLKSVANRLPPKSGVPNDPCDCTDHLSGGQQVDFVGCEHQVCYVVGKDCGVAFPSAKYPGAFMRLCTAT